MRPRTGKLFLDLLISYSQELQAHSKYYLEGTLTIYNKQLLEANIGHNAISDYSIQTTTWRVEVPYWIIILNITNQAPYKFIFHVQIDLNTY